MWNDRRHINGQNMMYVLGVIVFILLITNSSGGFPWWIFFFTFPFFRSSGSSTNSGHRPAEMKTKNDEKPKREPRYALGDDGELIELRDDEDLHYEESSPRQHSGYV